MMLLNPGLLLKPRSFPLESERLLLRLPQPRDWVSWYYIRERSRSFIEPWEPTWPPGPMTEGIYKTMLKNYYRKQRLQQGFYHFIFLKETGELIGAVNLIHVLFGSVQCASLGYWAGKEFTGNGFMTEAVGTVLPFAFETLGLHRVQAACLPLNPSSQRVLEKNGFSREGIARKYIKIQGEWRDHIIFALTGDDWKKQSGRPADTGQFLRIDT